MASSAQVEAARVAYIFAPPEVAASGVLSLETGGICSQSETRNALVSMMTQYLQDDDTNLIVLEDPFAKPTDELIEKIDSEWGWYQDEVYYFLSGGNFSREAIEAALNRAMDPLYFFGAFTRSPRKFNRKRYPLEADDFKEFIHASASVILGVFDGESFIQIPMQAHTP